MAEPTFRFSPSLDGAGPGMTDARGDPILYVAPPTRIFDVTTLIAMVFSITLIVVAIAMGNQDANFINLPSILIVVLGTFAVTCVSYTGRELRLALPVIQGAIARDVFSPQTLARELLDIAVIARKRGILQLNNLYGELAKNPFLNNTIQMAADGMTAADIDRLVHHDIDATLDVYKKAAGLLRRASEIAPAMGLIGTLIGLVQMLVSLDDPSRIGPAMALALLTTFYGAIMGSVVLAPLAAKIERNANEEVMIKTLIQTTATAILAQGNPRKLEMELNSILPPDQRVSYFEYGR
jgi:chemotaxis protein MotA